MGAVVLDQSAWAQLRATGSDRVRFLQGMLSNDVAGLAVGDWCRATMLSVKGRVLALVDACNEGDAVVLITEAAFGQKLHDLLDRHLIADDVTLTPQQQPLHRVWDSAAAVWTAPPVWATRAGSPSAALEALRVEAGLPRYGVDVSEEHFPFEANLARALSFGKGCYAGQEVVVRATTRGGAKKKLLGLRLDQVVPVGTRLVDEGGVDVGQLTSVATSPRLGNIALGYVHHSRWAPGTVLAAGAATAHVSELPFAG
jgi:folate-binding protein YgfZ